MLSALPEVYGTVETGSQVSWSLPRHSFYEKVLGYLGGMIIIGEIWQRWAARDGKTATQPSLATAQIQLNIIRKRAIQFVHFSFLSCSHAVTRDWHRTAQTEIQGALLGQRCLCLYAQPGDGGLLEAEAQSWWVSSAMRLALLQAHPGTVRDSDSKAIFTGPELFS